MYENYSRQAMPSRRYRELLGSALCVFNANNCFVIENVLRTDKADQFTWYELIDKTSGQLKPDVEITITAESNSEIADLFGALIDKRNRIVHSFQVTVGSSDDPHNQILATKHKDGRQELITEEYLLNFIKKNEILSLLLHRYRDSCGGAGESRE